MAETKISEIIQSSLEEVRSFADANTIIGEPIPTNSGTTIIPVSKVSVGIASGGTDFAGKKASSGSTPNFGGGGGTGLQIVPVAFLVVHADGSVEMMNVSNPTNRPADIGYNVASLVDKAPEIIEKLKFLFKKKKPAGEENGVTASDSSEESTEDSEATEDPTETAAEAADTAFFDVEV